MGLNRFRYAPAVLFILGSLILSGFPLHPELFANGKDKDYHLWYGVGQRVIYGSYMYDTKNGSFDFLYPPFAGVLLAIPSSLGKTGLVIAFTIGNVISWWAAVKLSNRLAVFGQPVTPVMAVMPSFLVIAFIYEMFFLGQPNLFLLVLMLGGFACLRKSGDWEIPAGGLFALAAAIKAFPVVVIFYLLWRRNWLAAGSMVLWLAFFLVLVPAPIRGYDKNLSELKQWANGMFSTDESGGFSQRSARNLGWKNQSLISVGHRYLRHINADEEERLEKIKKNETPNPPVYVNIVDLEPMEANLVILGVAGLIGLGYVLLMPARKRRTPLSNAAETGMMLSLMTIACPVAHPYYYVWFLFPYTVLIERAINDESRAVRRATIGLMVLATVLFCLSAEGLKPHYPQALGSTLAAGFVVLGALGWHMRRTAGTGIVAVPEEKVKIESKSTWSYAA